MPHHPFYSSKQWRDARSKHLRLHPLCATCLRIGIQTRGTEVDHRVTIASGGLLTDSSNLETKCRKHHSQKTRTLDTPNQPGRDRLVTTGPDGFPIYVEYRNGNPPKNR